MTIKNYEGLKRAISLKPHEVIEEVKKANLRGLGGAGFPTGLKWSFMPKEEGITKYLVCNGDEGEPGTFKDRFILHERPHDLLEGMAIAAYAMGIKTGYIYLRGEFLSEYHHLQKAIDWAIENHFLGKDILGRKNFDFHLYIYRGAGAYICGEETALLNSLEGKRGEPRLKPPFPAQAGLFGKPTCVNNVETLSSVPKILTGGAEAFLKNQTRLFSVSGHIEKPGVYEFPISKTLRELLDHCGGVRGGKALKAVIPGGASAPMLSAAEIDVKLDFDSLAQAKTMAGSGAVIVMDETVCMVRAASLLAKFYEGESCGQCSQCREGSHWLAKIFARIEAGKGREEDLRAIEDICHQMAQKTICAFADAVTGPALSSVLKFKEEFLAHIREQRCPYAK